jgi:2-hydroxy-6-oxo-octa-2,4-dienoate hydrolase
MIHGGGATLAEFAPLLGLLERDFHIYAPDRPGCGLSQMIDYSNISIRQQAVDCISSLFDQLGLQRAAVAGCSIGGYWALVFALAAPERVSKLVLLGGPAGSASHWPERMPPPRSQQPPPTLASTRVGYGFVMANADRASPEMMQTMLAAAQIPGATRGWDSLVSAAREQFPIPMSYALRPELKSLKMPALFAMGDKDMEGPPALGKEMAELAPQGRFELVPDSGHVIWLDKPEIVAQITRDSLLSKQPAASTSQSF